MVRLFFNKNIKSITIFLNLIIWTIAVSSFLFLIFIINKGFRFSDEGYYLIGYRKNQPLNTQLFFFHQLVRFFLGKYSTHIVILRVIRILLILVSTFFLTNAISKYRNEEKGSLKKYLIPIIFISLAISYSFGPQSLSYNSLNQFFIVVFLGLILFSLSVKNQSSILYYFLLGIVISFTFLTKLTSAFGLFLICAIVIFFNNNFKLSIIKFAVLFISFLLGLTALNFILNLNLISNFNNLYKFLQNGNLNHNSNLLWRSLFDFIIGIKFPAVFLICFIFLLRKINIYLKPIWVINIVLIFLVSSLLIVVKTNQLVNTSPFIILIFAWVAHLINEIVLDSGLSTSNYLLNRKNITLALLFVGLPIVGALGSDTGILRNTLMYVVFWFLIPVFMVIENRLNKINLVFYSFHIITVTFLFLVYSVWYNPFRSENLQQVKYLLGNPYHKSDKVYINKDQSQNLKILSSHLDSLGFKKGDFIFGLDNNLGYIFFLKGIIPGGFTFGKEGLPLYLYDFKKKYNSFDNFFVIIEKDEFNEINNIFQNSGFSLNNNHRKSIISQLNLIVLSPLKK